MKYYNVTSTKDGKPWCFEGHSVPESSLNSLRAAFAKSGVELHTKYVMTWADRPLYRKDPETGELIKDDEL